MIQENFGKYREMQEVLVFLQGHGIGIGQALRLYRHYGLQAADRVRDNPYMLAEEVAGIGFKTADRIARQMGLAADAPARVRAALLFALRDAAGRGDVCLPREILLERAMELLAIPGEVAAAPPLKDHLQKLAGDKKIYCEERAGEALSMPRPSITPR